MLWGGLADGDCILAAVSRLSVAPIVSPWCEGRTCAAWAQFEQAEVIASQAQGALSQEISVRGLEPRGRIRTSRRCAHPDSSG